MLKKVPKKFSDTPATTIAGVLKKKRPRCHAVAAGGLRCKGVILSHGTCPAHSIAVSANDIIEEVAWAERAAIFRALQAGTRELVSCNYKESPLKIFADALYNVKELANLIMRKRMDELEKAGWSISEIYEATRDARAVIGEMWVPQGVHLGAAKLTAFKKSPYNPT